MSRNELLRQTINCLNDTLKQQKFRPKTGKSLASVKASNSKLQIDRLVDVVTRCGDTTIAQSCKNQYLSHCREFKAISYKLNSLLENIVDSSILEQFIVRTKCIVQYLGTSSSKRARQPSCQKLLQKVYLQNVKLQKSIKTLAYEYKFPKNLPTFANQQVQTDHKIERETGGIDIRGRYLGQPLLSPNNQVQKEDQKKVGIDLSFLQRLQMQKEDMQTQLIRSLQTIEHLKEQIKQLNVYNNIYSYRKQYRLNPVSFFLPKLQSTSHRGHQSFINRLTQKGQFEELVFSKQRSLSNFLKLSSRHDINNILKHARMEEHPFRTLRTLRAIFDSLTIDLPLNSGYFQFPLYVHQWFRYFQIPYNLQKRSTDFETNKVVFVSALQDFNLSRLWDVLIFRQMLCNIYELDEIDFIVRVRQLLLKQPQIGPATGSEIVHLINFEVCKETITSAFRKYPTALVKPVIDKLSKTQIKIRNQYKIDCYFALRILLDLYKEIKSDRLIAFTTNIGMHMSQLTTLPQITQLLSNSFDSFTTDQLETIYFELMAEMITRPQMIWRHCINHGHFNNKIIHVAVETPKICTSDQSMKQCLKEYDKLAPLIGSFRRNIHMKGSIDFIEKEASLDLTAKIWACQIHHLLTHLNKLQKMIEETLHLYVIQTVHTSQRDTDLECSMVIGIMKCLSIKLNLWKKVQIRQSVFRDFVVDNAKKIQRMVRRHNPHVQRCSYIKRMMEYDLTKEQQEKLAEAAASCSTNSK